MPILKAAPLRSAIQALLEGCGASAEEAEIISRHSVAANLAGHDSHGVIQIPIYIDRVAKGHIVPGAPFDIKQETPTTTVIDGNWGFGYVVAERATKLTIEKAKAQNVAAATIFRQSHIGRVAAYPLMAAREGMIAIMTADSGRSPKHVAPFGGREARLGTNPICIAVPADLEAPLVVDMATSAVAAGKIKLAQAKGAQIPEGWIVDGDGKPTTDPFIYGKGGVLLPLGGPEGHKGYGLSAMVEILSALLPGLGFGVEPTGRHNDGCFLAVFKVSAFRDLATFKREVAEFAAYLKSTPPADGFNEVLYPGEIELRREKECLANGIAVDDKTWKQLKELADKFGIPDAMNIEAA
ncbi:MAG: Ldh family oxidoreductase [Hyphomicrobiaceae bacterium]|nr:Ldh family oxidoreductase [Hyphomicrobiaceae bacterium]